MITRALVAWPFVNGPCGSWAENFTALWTYLGRGVYVGHVEIQFQTDGGDWYRATATTDHGAVVTSTGTDGKPITYDERVYRYLELPAAFPIDEAVNFCLAESAAPGNGYDWAGIAFWLCRLIKPSKTKWYCSEIVAAMLALYPPYATFKEGDGQWSPAGVWRQLVKLGCQPPAPAPMLHIAGGA